MIDATMMRRPLSPRMLPTRVAGRQTSVPLTLTGRIWGRQVSPQLNRVQSDLAVTGPISPRLRGKLINGDPTAKKTSRLADQISLSFAYLSLLNLTYRDVIK
jgi:hypothetical protein